jgi:hypothetical protein
MTEDYVTYSLKENPFPQVATVNLDKADIRVNGTIFTEEILSEEVSELRDKIDKRTAMVYVTGLKFDKGTGKSALIVHQWRKLSTIPNTTSVLVRCNPKDKPADLALAIATKWHEQNYLWEATRRLLSKFSIERKDVRLSPENIETMFNAYPRPPERLPLTLYTHVSSPERLSKTIADWISSLGNQLNPLFLEQFFSLYLTKPAELPERISQFKTRGLDQVGVYANLLEMLFQSGFKDNFVFLDQLEDTIMFFPAGRIGGFCLDMKRMLEAGIGRVVTVVTLHPDSEMKLNTQAAQHLLKIAPLDSAHRVDVLALEVTGNETLALAADYMNHFRTGAPEYPTWPLHPDVIRYVSFLKEGNVRETLQQLHQCLKFAASNGNPEVKLDYVLEHHEGTLGTLRNPALYEEFRKKVNLS